jgi:RNA polymerase sigma-70 factor (ECF subfamily)
LRASERDRDVIDLVEKGDVRGALRLLMDRHGAPVYRYCCGALHDAALAADVQQQAFIEAFRHLPTFSGRSAIRTWLFAIARHRVLDAAKARTRAQARLETDNMTDASDPWSEPGERLDDVRLREAFTACRDELDENVRTALLLRYQQGFTFEQMAEICGEKAGTLQVRVAGAPDAAHAVAAADQRKALARGSAGNGMTTAAGWTASVGVSARRSP